MATCHVSTIASQCRILYPSGCRLLGLSDQVSSWYIVLSSKQNKPAWHKIKEPDLTIRLLCAVGETRTRTGLLPLPPQSSVSTISPPPLCLFWDCKGTTKKLNSKFFCTFFAKIFTFFVRACFWICTKHSFSTKSLYSHFYLLSLRAFPRVGSMVFNN